MISVLKKKCLNYEYISFDLFDTLIKRMTRSPYEVFELIEESLIDDEGVIENFAIIRAESEKEARYRKKTEITIEEIYSIISERFGEEKSNKYKSKEIELELKLCFAVGEMKELYEWCKTKEKTILIVTDMYMPRPVIEEILCANGYSGYTELFISCELKKTKSEGTLYEELINYCNDNPNRILHIGDNLRSDVIMAYKKGIHSFWVRNRDRFNLVLDKNEHGFSLYKFILNTTTSEDLYSKAGYCCFGPLLYGFTNWIIGEIRSQKIEKVFFFSRDGFIMQKMYDRIKKEYDPDSSYFYASRRALQVAAIHLNPEYSYVMSHMYIPRHVTTKWLLNRWGICSEVYENKNLDLDLEQQHAGEDILDNDDVRKLYKTFYNEIISNSEREYRAFIKYLDEKEFGGKVAIVDIGWYGNMQNSLMQILRSVNNDTVVSGLYLGVVPNSPYWNQQFMKGYLFSKEKNECLFPRIKDLNSIMELFFLAPHGSLVKYIIRDNKPDVMLSEFEYDGTDTYEKIAIIQASAFEFASKYKQKAMDNINEIDYFASLYQFFACPNNRIADAYGDLCFWDDRWIKLAQKNCAIKWIVNPREAKDNFLGAPWKMGYLKRNLKLPFRYDAFVSILRRIIKQ